MREAAGRPSKTQIRWDHSRKRVVGPTRPQRVGRRRIVVVVVVVLVFLLLCSHTQVVADMWLARSSPATTTSVAVFALATTTAHRRSRAFPVRSPHRYPSQRWFNLGIGKILATQQTIDRSALSCHDKQQQQQRYHATSIRSPPVLSRAFAPRRRRQLSSRLFFSSESNEVNHAAVWTVPDFLSIPEDQLDISFVRSSGAGGQNVNKVSSCVQVRFAVAAATWMPLEVRDRFATLYANQINQKGVYSTESQVHRTQVANRKHVLAKLQTAVLAAWPRPKVRTLREGIGPVGKAIRKQEKQKHKLKKEGRRPVDF